MREAVSWVLYWLGDWVSKALWRDRFVGFIYPIYNRLMIWSNQLQGDGPGPWEKSEKG